MSSGGSQSPEPRTEPATAISATREATELDGRVFRNDETARLIRTFLIAIARDTEARFPKGEKGQGFKLAVSVPRNLTVWLNDRLPPRSRDPDILAFQSAQGATSFCERCRALMSKDGLLQASTESGYIHTRIDNWNKFQTELGEKNCLLCKYIFTQWPGKKDWNEGEPIELLIYADFIGNALNGLETFFKFTPSPSYTSQGVCHLFRPTEHYIRTIAEPGRHIVFICSNSPTFIY
jgi:hypothetical protein